MFDLDIWAVGTFIIIIFIWNMVILLESSHFPYLKIWMYYIFVTFKLSIKFQYILDVMPTEN